MANVTHKYANTVRPAGNPPGVANPVTFRYSPIGNGDGVAGEITATLDITTDNLSTGDLWNFITLPSDFVIEEVWLEVSDMDSNGTPALDIQIKANDGTTTTAFNAADLTTAQAGGIAKTDQNAPLSGHADDVTVYVEVTTGAATAAAGTATMVVKGFTL